MFQHLELIEHSYSGIRVGILTWQKVFLPGQWKKPVITGKNYRQKLAKTLAKTNENVA